MPARTAVATSEAPSSSSTGDEPLVDLRFRALLSEAEWSALSHAVRRRFSKRLAEGKTAIYVGKVVEAWTSRAGWLLVQALRMIGGPLPISRDAQVPSVVTVTEDMASGGQV